MARPVGHTKAPNGKARVTAWLPADLRDRLARAAFEAGEPMSALLARGAELVLAAAQAQRYEVPREQWVDIGEHGWATVGATSPADPQGTAFLEVHQEDRGWRWEVRVAKAEFHAKEVMRTRTAAMVEAEAQAAALTPEDLERAQRPAAKRSGRRLDK